jgi:glyoxylase-like metal-dependent hydrolase (beta-lactamase superfamily II)
MTWHTVSQISPNAYCISEPIGSIEPRFGVRTINMYLIIGQEQAALIDSGMGVGDVRAEIRKMTSLPCMVMNTHYHWDHICANHHFAERAIHELEAGLLEQKQDLRLVRKAMGSPSARSVLPASFNPATYRHMPMPATRILHDREEIDLGDCLLEVLHIPGHSPGHVAYFHRSAHLLFTGDTACPGPVYACFEGSDPGAFSTSLKRLAALRDVETICPGHNDIVREKDWLAALAASFEAVLLGKVEGQWRDEFVVGREFRFDQWSIWLP